MPTIVRRNVGTPTVAIRKRQGKGEKVAARPHLLHPRDLADLDDTELVQHSDQGAAFSILYERYALLVLRYCLTRIHDQVEAEDVAAQILAKAYAGFPPDSRGPFRSWLFAIAHHTVVDFYRRASRGPGIDRDPTILDTFKDPSPSAEEETVSREERDQLYAAITYLTDDQQQVLALRMAGMKGADIALQMNRSHQAVKMLQFRAVSRLRELLETGGAEPTNSPTTGRNHDAR